MTEKFCSQCGTPLITRETGGRLRPACPSCGYVRYGRFSIGAGGLLIQDGRILLVQRGEEPGRGWWSLPGGYCEEDETPNEAAVREVYEETALRVRALDLLAVRNTLRPADQHAYYLFRVELTEPGEIHADGKETLQAGFFMPAEVDTLGQIVPLVRWLLAHPLQFGLQRMTEEAKVKPLTGNRFTLYTARAI